MALMKLTGLIIGIMILAGCLSQPQGAPSKEGLLQNLSVQNAAIAQPGLITSSDQGPVQVVTIRSVNGSFPMTIYSQRFLFAGLYSDTFVMLNGSQIRWMGPNESIWLTVYRGNGSGVVFNAIYSNTIDDCGAGGVEMLGKNYSIGELRNGSSFGNDDKWKVSLDSINGCPTGVAVYLDGYFDGLKDGEQIPLFRNDNTVLLEFDDLEGVPLARVIATRPGG